MHLRYLVLKLCLDIEHTLKTLLMNIITDDSGEDGYKIIEDFNNYSRRKFEKNNNSVNTEYQHVKDRIIKEVKNIRDYNYDFYMKTKEKISIWKLIEMMSYGQLVEFINFYDSDKRHKSKSLKKAVQFLGYSKNLRDSSAHSRPILLNITEINQLKGNPKSHKTNQSQAEPELKVYARQNGLDKRVVSRLLTNFKIHDLCALILLHDEYVQSKHMRKARKREMLKLYKRALYKKGMYDNISDFNEILELFFGIVKKY